jgi:hypothetical protein
MIGNRIGYREIVSYKHPVFGFVPGQINPYGDYMELYISYDNNKRIFNHIRFRIKDRIKEMAVVEAGKI